MESYAVNSLSAGELRVVLEQLTNPACYVEDREAGFHIARSLLPGCRHEAIVGGSWLDFKLAIQDASREFPALGLLMPTSAHWGHARRFYQDHEPEGDKSFISGPFEWVDSLLAFVEVDYPDEVHDLLKSAGFDGRLALVTGSTLAKEGARWIVAEGEVTDVTELDGSPLPKMNGYVSGYDWSTGLVTRVGTRPDPAFFRGRFWVRPEGVRAIIRGFVSGSWGGEPRRFRRYSLGAHLGIDTRSDQASARVGVCKLPARRRG